MPDFLTTTLCPDCSETIYKYAGAGSEAGQRLVNDDVAIHCGNRLEGGRECTFLIVPQPVGESKS